MAPQNCVPNPVTHTPSLQSLEVGFESFIESIMGPESDKAGLARISLPHKYWSKAGISHDESARGPSWQKGEHLGDMEIASPIKQAAAGKGGVYGETELNNPTPAHISSSYSPSLPPLAPPSKPPSHQSSR